MKFKQPNRKGMELNLTSMMDVVFLLIIFFILVTNFSAADLPPLEPPDPIPSAARKIEGTQPRIVNIVPVTVMGVDPIRGTPKEISTGQANYVMAYDMYFAVPGYRMHLPRRDEDVANPISVLVDQLTAERLRREELGEPMEVDLRVDKSIPYESVQPVMSAITNAQITRVNLVALVPAGQD